MCWNFSTWTMGKSTGFRLEPAEGGIDLYFLFFLRVVLKFHLAPGL